MKGVVKVIKISSQEQEHIYLVICQNPWLCLTLVFNWKFEVVIPVSKSKI